MRILFTLIFIYTINFGNSQIASWTSSCDGSSPSTIMSGFGANPISISHDCVVSCLSTTEGALTGDEQNETVTNDQGFSFGLTNNTVNSYTLSSLNYDVQRSSSGFNTWFIELSIDGNTPVVIDPSETWTGTSQASRTSSFSVTLPAGSTATFNVVVSGYQGNVALTCNTAGNNGTFRFINPQINGSVLPVEFLRFLTKENLAKTIINFSTASETNNDYFTIERSGDGRNFDAIGEIKGAGNSTEDKHYEFTDENPLPGINYYRIKQTDYDGQYSYSEIKSVRFKGVKNISITPRTTEGSLHITTDMEDYTISIFTAAGQEVKSFTSMSLDQNISIEELKAGIYFVRVNNGSNSETIRIVKI